MQFLGHRSYRLRQLRLEGRCDEGRLAGVRHLGNLTKRGVRGRTVLRGPRFEGGVVSRHLDDYGIDVRSLYLNAPRGVPEGRVFGFGLAHVPLSRRGNEFGKMFGSPDIKVGRSPGRSDQELCDLGRNRLIHGFFWDLPEQYFLASVDGRLRRPRSGWGACSAAAKSRRKAFNLWLLLDDRWAGDTAQVEPVR